MGNNEAYFIRAVRRFSDTSTGRDVEKGEVIGVTPGRLIELLDHTFSIGTVYFRPEDFSFADLLAADNSDEAVAKGARRSRG